ncbi:MAG: S41 family peptidase [Chloroflexota bacterium]
MLVNGGTASARRDRGGALLDTGRATLVGEKTFGKGTVQQWHLLSDDAGGFRLSVAKWLTPDKTWIHGIGITPDVVVAPGPPGDEDPQLAKALEIVVGALRDGGPGPAVSPVATTPPVVASPSASSVVRPSRPSTLTPSTAPASS